MLTSCNESKSCGIWNLYVSWIWNYCLIFSFCRVWSRYIVLIFWRLSLLLVFIRNYTKMFCLLNKSINNHFTKNGVKNVIWTTITHLGEKFIFRKGHIWWKNDLLERFWPGYGWERGAVWGTVDLFEGFLFVCLRPESYSELSEIQGSLKR